MKKKVFSLMMTLLLAFVGVAKADGLTVHDGTTTNSYVPFYGLWVDDYTRSEMIYPASELSAMSGADINSLTFYKSDYSNTSSWGAANFQVYLKEVTNTTLSSYIGMTGATIVYDGAVNAAGGEIQVTINFTTPYHYNGGNLLVGVYETYTGTYSSAYWYGENVTGASASGYSSSSPADASFSSRDFLPKTTFDYTPGGGGQAVSEIIDFEDGVLPEGWTVEGPGEWTVGVGDYSTSTGTHSGDYNALCTHSSTGNMTYLVSPMFNFANALDGTINCWFVNRSWAGDIDFFGVYYRVNGGTWQELYYTTDAHSSWTEMGEIQLTGFANNYQIGFLMSDDYGYGVGLDDIEINVTLADGPGYEVVDAIEIEGFVAPTWGVTPVDNTYVPEDANYTLVGSGWSYYYPSRGETREQGRLIEPDPNFTELDDRAYYMYFYIEANEGYGFTSSTEPLLNGEANMFHEDSQIDETEATLYTIDFFPADVYEEGLHTLAMYGVGENAYENIDRLLIERPNGAWMEPYHFQLYNDGSEDVEVVLIDFLHNNGYFSMVEETEYPFTVANTGRPGVDLYLNTNIDWTDTDQINSLLAVNTTERSTHLYQILAAPYRPFCPDVVEMAYNIGNINAGTEWSMWTSEMWNHTNSNEPYELHDNYTLPFPEIPEGYDAVMQFTLNHAMMLNAAVTDADCGGGRDFNGKVALYRSDFNGQPGPMADNYYDGRPFHSESAVVYSGIDFETGNFSQFNSYTNDGTYPWYVAADAAYGGSYGMRSGNAGVASSTSTFTATVNYNTDGTVSFDYNSRGEGSTYLYDVSRFYIDGVEQFSYGAVNAWNSFSANVTAGEHTFTWSYSKDSSVNNEGDCFYVDNIVFDGGRLVGELDRELISIADGGSNAVAIPVNFIWAYTENQMILTADEIGTDGMITSVAYKRYSEGSGVPEARNIDIYMMHTSLDAYATTADWIPVTAADRVFSGTYTFQTVGTDWQTITLDTPFAYNGTDNLCICIDDNTGTTTERQYWSTHTTPANRSMRAWGNANFDPTQAGVPVGGSSLTGNWAADIQLNIDDQIVPIDPDQPVEHAFSAGPVIEGLNVLPGTYYLVASSTCEDFEVSINFEELPCPIEPVTGIYPADNAYDIPKNNLTLRWTLNDYCNEYRLVFSSTYWPDDEPNHPATYIGEWTSDLAESFRITDVVTLYNNTNYFWRIDQRSNAGTPFECVTEGPVFGFTTHLNVPMNLQASQTRIFEYEDTVTLTWNAIQDRQDRTYRQYRIYKDGELLHSTPFNQVVTSYTIPQDELTYNMYDQHGYIFNVTAVYDEGESPMSNPAEIWVSGNGTVSGYVYEQDEVTPIGGVTVTITGTNEFGDPETYTFTTDEDGYYEGPIHAGNYNNAVATMAGYQDAITTHELPFAIVYDEETEHVDFIMDELFIAPAHVCAQTTFVQGVQGDSLVHVWWDFNFCEDFEAQIGNGTSTVSYMPFYTLYDNSVSTALYRADELEAAGVNTAPITSLSWYATNAPGYAQQGITIWMANVADTQVSATSPMATGMTKVYTGAMTPAIGWNEFVFNEDSFEWDGESNILILVQRNNGDWNSTVSWQSATTSFNSMSYVYRDGTSYNVENETYAMSVSTSRPNVIMKATCDRAQAADRSLHHFNIYRTDCYNDGPYNSDNTVFLASVWRPDTSYMDVHWPEAPVGVYKWGVSAVYAGNYDGNPNNPRIDYPFEERESEIVWSDLCGPCIDKDMYLDSLVTVNVVLNSADNPEGTVVTFVNNNPGEQFNHPMAPITLDQTGYYVFPRFRKGDYTVTVEHEGFFTLEVQESIWEPRDLRYVLIEKIFNVQNLYVSRTGWAMWEPNGTLSNPEDDPMLGRHLEGYKVMCTSIDGEPIFNHNTPVDQPFCQLATDELVEGEHYIINVAAIYSTGMSDYTSAEWQYEPCDNYAGTVNGLEVEGSTVSWEYPGGGVTPGPNPGEATTFTVGFEGGLPEGWTVTDANNDGNTWTATSAIPTTWTYYAGMSLDWYHTGSDAMCSGSYINGVGAVNPDEYLITPQVNLVAGSQLSFWVAACDESYPADHFGVFVSTTGTNPSDFTSVQEWTLAAKAGGNGHADAFVRNTVGRDSRNARLGTWYHYTVDLSAYAGEAYIAFRHFNCYDQYIMCLDDVELTAGAKSGVRNPWDLITTLSLYSAGQQAVATDGEFIYTASWQGTPTGGNRFYKYGLDGTFIGGFEIAGMNSIGVRDFTSDGQYFYCGASSSTLYCLDLANQTLVGQTSTNCAAIRHCSYDPVRDGFWMGDWSTLALYSRTGALIQSAPAPSDAYGSAYYKDENDVEHLYLFCQPNSDCQIYDYNITTNTLGTTPMFSFSASTPGCTGIAGGAFIGEYNGMTAFFGNSQQDPNLIGIYELATAPVDPTPVPSEGILGAMIFVDGEWEAFVEYPTNSYTYVGDGQEICVRMVYDGTAEMPDNNFYYAMSCDECVGGLEPVCEPGAPIYAEITADDQVRVYWSEPVPPTPEEGDVFTYNFDNSSIEGLTLIDNDGDGNNWMLGSTAMATGYGHNASTDMILSKSYDNNTGALTPDNYIVFPQANIVNGSTFSFYACGQDASWAGEHFGVAVSTEGNTSASDFSTIAEWTMTAKGTKAVRDGRDQGNWYQYTVDLSDYAGMPVYIALRHFNCTDMFYLDVDDVELSIAAKGNRDGIIGYNIYRSTDNVDYALIATVDGNVTEYFDNPGTGTFYYQVTALYDGCESEPAVSGENPDQNYVMVGRTGIGENSDNVNLFPNPTKGNVTIQAMNMHRITVVSVLGQVVFDTELDQDEYILNMAQFNTGMYMVRVYTDEGVTVKRVTVLH